MSRSSLSWPISLLAGFGVFLLLVLVGSLNDAPAVAQGGTCSTSTSGYPACVTQTARAEADAAGRCDSASSAYPACATQTAAAAGVTDTVPSTDNNNNNNNNNNTNQQATATSTFTPTATRAVTSTTSAQPTDSSELPATPTATRPASPSDDPAQSAPPTPTPALPPGVTTIACVPGETVELSGEAAPNTPLLLFFGERPVGGGVSGPGGSYRLRLQIGEERPGLYLVEVRERAGRTLVDQYGCEVPAVSPTPTPLQ
jgi:hypothetical protein